MTRKSKREIERALEQLQLAHGHVDEPMTFEFRSTIVGTGWDGAEYGSGLEEGEVVEETETVVIEP